MFGNTSANNLLKLVYNATAWANVADNAASSPLTNIYATLNTAFPGYAGAQNTSEAAYGSYARVAIARTTGGFTVTSNTLAPVSDITFPAATSGNESECFVTLGVASSGASAILNIGVIGSALGPFTGATDDTITMPGLSGVAVDDRITFLAPHAGMSLPTGLTEGTVYWVKTVSGNVVTVASTQGGSTIDLTAVGDGLAFKVTPIPVTAGTTPRLTAASVSFVLR
jgi:hypothetical protein